MEDKTDFNCFQKGKLLELFNKYLEYIEEKETPIEEILKKFTLS